MNVKIVSPATQSRVLFEPDLKFGQITHDDRIVDVCDIRGYLSKNKEIGTTDDFMNDMSHFVKRSLSFNNENKEFLFRNKNDDIVFLDASYAILFLCWCYPDIMEEAMNAINDVKSFGFSIEDGLFDKMVIANMPSDRLKQIINERKQ